MSGLNVPNNYSTFAESATESLKVLVSTNHYIIEGNIYLSRSMKENRRLTNLLNGDKRFIALTDAMVSARVGTEAERKPEKYPFLHINLDSIELIKPIEDRRD